MTIQTATPFPTEGLRKLSPRETMQRLQALNCTLPKDNKPACTSQLNIGIFFDGTGNNMHDDFEVPPPDKRKHSNVVRLYQAYTDLPSKGYLKYYIPGVGTPFPEIGDSGPALGGGAAWGGEPRILWAFTQLLNAPHFYVLKTLLLSNTKAATIANSVSGVGNPNAHRRLVLKTWQSKLKAELEGAGVKPKITLINLSVFGFSRGSAQARAFVNWLFEVCEQKDGGWLFAGIPIRLQFLGILDTVASVGLTDLFDGGIVEGRQSWADHNMGIHPAVEQCVHFVASHEVRACFPSDLVRNGMQYPPNVKEVMYPGAHSDVGGGYTPNAVGISPEQDSYIATIPGARMYQEAILAGVPLLSWDNLGALGRKNFTASPKVIEDFNAYLSASGFKGGVAESIHKQQMSLYLSYRYKYRNTYQNLGFYKRANAKDKKYLQITSESINQRLRKLSAYPIPPESEEYDFKTAVKLQKEMAKAAGLTVQDEADNKQLYYMLDHIDVSKLTPRIEHFFETYLHDSMSGFIGMGEINNWLYNFTNEFARNGHGIMRFRTIFAGD